MPAIEPYFDVGALCAAAHELDHGLFVTTNNPAAFRRILYTHFRRQPEHRLAIISDPDSAVRFLLLKRALENYVAEATTDEDLPDV